MARVGRSRGRNTRRHLIAANRGRLVCHYCRRSIAYDDVIGDHATPLARGGPDRMHNIVPACPRCDHLKGPLTAEEFLSVMGDDQARKALIAAVQAELRDAPIRRRASDRRTSR